MTPVIYWHRHDLRLQDNPALQAAIATQRPLIPVYILEPMPVRQEGGASKWWLHHSLSALSDDYRKRGVTLLFFQGDARGLIIQLCQETGADQVFWNRRYDQEGIGIDKEIKAHLKAQDLSCQSFNSHLLFEPWEIKNGAGNPYQVFTPFWKNCLEQIPSPPLSSVPEQLCGGQHKAGDDLADWQLLPNKPDWAQGLRETWQPGEVGAYQRLMHFLEHALATYKEDRNRPDLPHTSLLSPHLSFGEISPRQIWQATKQFLALHPECEIGAACFLSEIGWREFSYHLLYHFPKMPTQPLREKYNRFPWQDNPAFFKAWTKGLTGYPIIDAGMRQLWHTGWMHNRVRMIVASFLVKDLLISWQDGEKWFWDTLVDADIASNSAGWQWVSGCGADAAPYFRIFNPILQGEKFDPYGSYVRQWVPELQGLPDTLIHKPWTASKERLAAADVYLGRTYPAPIVDHDKARSLALQALQSLGD